MTAKTPNRLVLLILIVALVSGAVYLASLASPKKPNILILYADDLGYGDLRCYNPDSKIPTPHLDHLASQGMRFTDGHSSSGICTPSRYALLTGRYHWRKFHRIVGTFGPSVFDAEELTLPEMLRESGYNTAAIGKWHLGWDWAALQKPGAGPTPIGKGEQSTYTPDALDWGKPIPNGPLAHGFDSYFGDDVINFPPYCWIENDRVTRAPDTMMDEKAWKPVKEGTWEARPGPMVSGWNPYENLPTTTARAVSKIHELAGKSEPFFLYFAFPSPHAPIIPNDEFDGTSQAGPYGDFVVETDAACGKILAALEDAGIAKNTLVIFTSDNGPEWYAYARDQKHGHWSAHPLRGLKRDLYEGGHRVPFIVRWPGVTQPGTVSKALVSQIDLMATLASALKYNLPDNQAEDSHDLLPVLRGAPKGSRDTLVYNTFPDAYAIRQGDWVLIDARNGYHSKGFEPWEKDHAYSKDDASPFELYNLGQDLGQRHDVTAAYPETADKLRSQLHQIRANP